MTETQTTPQTPPQARARNHRTTGIVLAGVAFAMLGAAYAAVPLYSLFCQVTGYAGTTRRALAPATEVLDRTMTVRFDGNVVPGLDWEFGPVEIKQVVRIGENRIAHFRATNHSDRAIVGTATFNVTPEQAGVYFNKLQCFCFTEQRLEPGQTVDMPVSYFIDPAIVKDPDAGSLDTITLSYTFYPVKTPARNKSAAVNGGPVPPKAVVAPRGG